MAAPPTGNRGRPARHYSVTEVAAVLLCTLACGVLLDARGLEVWASRLAVGRLQSALLWVLRPAARLEDRTGLGWPRRAAVAASDAWAARFSNPVEVVLPATSVASEAADLAAPVLEMDPLLVVGAEAPPDAGPLEVAALDAGPADAHGVASLTGALAAAEVDAGPPPPVKVLLVGDSMMAAGLAGAIARGLEDEEGVRVVRAYKEATGLSRPDVYDWLEVLPPLLAKERPGLVVCSMGGNDAQAIREGDEVLEFGTRRWRAAYRRRVRKFMALLAGAGKQVLWLGLPPMRAADFNDRASRMNALYSAESRSVARVEFEEVAAAVAGPDGAFASFATDAEGNLVQLRLDDGVHYARAGGEAVARQAIDWIRARRRPSPLAAVVSAAPASAP